MLDNQPVKVMSLIVLIFVLITGSFAGIKVEAHDDHTHEESHALDITYHEHDHVNKTKSEKKDSHPDCPHYHIHCTSCVVGLVDSIEDLVTPANSYFLQESFTHLTLIQQDYSSSPLRPPIA